MKNQFYPVNTMALIIRQGYPVALFLIILLFPILLYPWASLPGSGLNRTANLLTWILICALGLALLPLLPRRLWAGKTAGFLATGLLLLSLPSLWTISAFRPDALYRLAGYAALTGLLWLLLPLPVRGSLRHKLYGMIVVAGLLQVILSVWQVLLPRSAGQWLRYDFVRAAGRATGAFGQANLLGSFLATSLLCALWLMLSVRGSQDRQMAAAAAVVLFAGLIISGSRSACLGATAGVSILMLCAAGSRPRLYIICVLAAGVLTGVLFSSLRPTAVVYPGDLTGNAVTISDRQASDRVASGNERLALTKGALWMIASHPVTGWGMGSFESAFPRVIASHGLVNPFPITVTHPHNELLYVWSEGGVTALAGLLCWLWLWLIPLRPVTGLVRQRPAARHIAARGALTLPLMIHVMTEFPFYLSAAHGVLMVVLLWLALPASARRGISLRNRPKSMLVFQLSAIAICLGGMVFMAAGLQSSLRIRDAESTGLSDTTPLAAVLNPMAQPERLQFDLAEENLLRFNFSRNAEWLHRFQQQAGAWLTVHNDAYLIDAMMRISHAQQDRVHTAYWRDRGCMSFHLDPRFHCDSAVPGRIKEDK